MPFPDQTPRAFTRASVEALTPKQIGCYGLFREGFWVYVGKGDIRDRLLRHLNGDTFYITQESPTHYVYEVTADMNVREKQLILELDPICNRRVFCYHRPLPVPSNRPLSRLK